MDTKSTSVGKQIAADAVNLYEREEIVDLAARIDAAINDAVRAERESCAKIADSMFATWYTALDISAAIRGRRKE